MLKRKLFYSSILFLSITRMSLKAQKPIYLDNKAPIEKRIESALSLMTFDEKIAMCHAQSKFSSKGVARLGIPEVWTSDGPHGIRQEVFWDEWSGAKWTNDSCTAFPALTCLAATFNPEISYLYGKSIGEEARYRNKNVLLGPGVNIYRTPLNGRNFEYMGEDPCLASRMVVPYIHGVQENNVAACVKHYALNNQEEKRMSIDVKVSDRALYEIYLPAFKAAVEEGKVWSIMGAYNQFRGEHACHNDLLLNKILKQDWKFDGVVISDWGGVHITDQAVNNGLDLEMGTSTDGLSSSAQLSYSDYHLASWFSKGIKAGKYSEDVLDDKVRRILRMIFRTTMSDNRPYGKFVSPEHSEAARQIAEQGIVLLKNEKQILPVSIGKFKNIAVIGENASKSLTIGGGSSSLKVAYEILPLEGLENKYGKNNITYSLGYVSASEKNELSKLEVDSLMSDAIELAKKSDIVFFVGGLNKNHYQDCEGVDRKSMELPYNQNKLIEALTKVNKNVVVVLLTGNAVEMPWLKNVQGLLQGWYLGSEAGNALANVISGEVSPSGKLPFSFPKKLEDNSAHSFGEKSYPGDGVTVEYSEDILVGYRWHDTKKIAPLFPFGYGLSYSTFNYGTIQTDKKTYSLDELIKVSFTLTNSGKVDAAESVQIYMAQKNPSVMRPTKELKGFKKVFLKAGETQTVEIELSARNFAFYDEVKKDWVVENDEFTLYNAASAGDVKSKTSIKILL